MLFDLLVSFLPFFSYQDNLGCELFDEEIRVIYDDNARRIKVIIKITDFFKVYFYYIWKK